MNGCYPKMFSRGSNNNILTASYKIVSEFENTSEKECSKFDKENEKIYSRLLSQAQKAQKAIKNSGLSMNLEVPIPPRPSNRDRYILWKKRNIKTKVIEQTEAVLYLQSKGYRYNEHYEAYQAIDLANEIKRTNGEPLEFKDNSKNFDKIYTKKDNNILRRRSVVGLNQHSNAESTTDSNTQSNSNKLPSIYPMNELNTIYNNDFEENNHCSFRRSKSLQHKRTSIYGFDYLNDDYDISNNHVISNHHGIPNRHEIQNGPRDNGLVIIENKKLYDSTSNRNRPQSVHFSERPQIISYPDVGQNVPQVNYRNIEKQNTIINMVKPSAPPATKTLIGCRDYNSSNDSLNYSC